mmetsp:Transcript_16396/g.40503  ORF Transcript_16396/g.40503 Transcript_16396/m.40503 type:complete len:237 (-) Transcript_16396:187-897(-)
MIPPEAPLAATPVEQLPFAPCPGRKTPCAVFCPAPVPLSSKTCHSDLRRRQNPRCRRWNARLWGARTYCRYPSCKPTASRKFCARWRAACRLRHLPMILRHSHAPTASPLALALYLHRNHSHHRFHPAAERPLRLMGYFLAPPENLDLELSRPPRAPTTGAANEYFWSPSHSARALAQDPRFGNYRLLCGGSCTCFRSVPLRDCSSEWGLLSVANASYGGRRCDSCCAWRTGLRGE